MKKLFEFKDFDSFVQGINENCTQRNSAISTAVSKLKDEFGDTKEKFLKISEKKKKNACKLDYPDQGEVIDLSVHLKFLYFTDT